MAAAATPTLRAARIRPILSCWMVPVVQASLFLSCCCCAFQLQPLIFAAPSTRVARTAPNPNTNPNFNVRLCDLPGKFPSYRTVGRPLSGASEFPARNGAGLWAAADVDGDGLGGGDGGARGRGEGDGFAADKRYQRKPRGKNLVRDAVGLPVEKVYAPRQSAYGKPVVGGTGRTKKVRPQGEEREVSINNAARLKVAGGVAKGRRLESPDVFLRPMMAKVKEALFSTLTGFGVFETGDARFLDLFSGSGSVGIEALSRGAGHATFVDFAKDCCEVCLRNGHLCGFEGKTKAVRGDVMDVLYNPRKYGLDAPFDVVTVTPPYEEVVYADLVKALHVSDLVAQDTIVVLEYPVELGCMPHAIGDGTMVGLRNRRYGRTVVGIWVYLPSGQFGDMLDSRPEEFITIKKK